jgi:hypothetical protein
VPDKLQQGKSSRSGHTGVYERKRPPPSTVTFLNCRRSTMTTGESSFRHNPVLPRALSHSCSVRLLIHGDLQFRPSTLRARIPHPRPQPHPPTHPEPHRRFPYDARVTPTPRGRTHPEPVHPASRQSRAVAHGRQLQQSLERTGGSSGGGIQILRGQPDGYDPVRVFFYLVVHSPSW